MRKKRLSFISLGSVLFLLTLLIGIEAEPVTINHISVDSLPLHTNIILKTNAPLPINRSYYSTEGGTILVLEFESSLNAEFPKSLPSFIHKLTADIQDSNTFLFQIYLEKRLPYRIMSQSGQTTIELNHIQNANKYLYDPDQVAPSSADPLSMRKVDISKENDGVNVTIFLTGQTTPQVFFLENPSRLVCDLYNTVHAIPTMNRAINKGGVKAVRSAQFARSNPHTISRLVFDLSEVDHYALNSDNGQIRFSFEENPTYVFSSDEAPTEQQESVPIPLDKPQEKEPTPPSVEKPKTAPVSTHNLQEEEPAPPAREESEPEPSREPEAEPVQEEETVSDQRDVQTLTETETRYSGQLVSARFMDADLRDVILTLSAIGNLNVVFNPEVRGTVTVDLVDIPWDQAMDLILKENRMGRTIEGNVLRIVPIRILTQEQEEERRLAESQELAGPIEVKTFKLSYARAKEVQALLKGRKSDRGEIIVDDRTNTLVISEVKQRMEILELLIEVFDQATPQVSIEARIVEATSNFVRNLGIQWGWRGISDPFYGNQTSLQFPNKALIDGSQIPGGIATKGVSGPLGGYAINLPAPSFSTVAGFSFANVLDTFRIDMALSALETSGEGRIISCPTITTQNNMQAEIIQGRQIPVQTTANFTVTTRYQNAALELRATPQITAEGTIIMTVEIQNNNADFANLVNGIPPIIMQSAKATVMVIDGGTTVIGGIYRTEDSITKERVPFLHKIPLLGNLFKSSSRTRQNRELLIFITPRILK